MGGSFAENFAEGIVAFSNRDLRLQCCIFLPENSGGFHLAFSLSLSLTSTDKVTKFFVESVGRSVQILWLKTLKSFNVYW